MAGHLYQIKETGCPVTGFSFISGFFSHPTPQPCILCSRPLSFLLSYLSKWPDICPNKETSRYFIYDRIFCFSSGSAALHFLRPPPLFPFILFEKNGPVYGICIKSMRPDIRIFFHRRLRSLAFCTAVPFVSFILLRTWPDISPNKETFRDFLLFIRLRSPAFSAAAPFVSFYLVWEIWFSNNTNTRLKI